MGANGVVSNYEDLTRQFFQVYGASDIGKVRDENQDDFLIIQSRSFVFCAICDGMGGAKGGSLASKMLTEKLRQALSQAPDSATFEALVDLVVEQIKIANDEILSCAVKDPSFANMGTTISALLIKGTSLQIFNVGDSRIYRLRDDNLEKLTEDHTLVNELLKSGLVKDNDISLLPLSHILTRSVGPAANLAVDSYCLKDGPIAGDIYLICSDGLYNMVSETDIKRVLRKSNIHDACKALIDLANQNGGHDNISVILVQVDERFPVTKADISSLPREAISPSQPAVVMDDVYTPVIADYLRKIQEANNQSRNFWGLTIFSAILLAGIFLVSEVLFFSKFDEPVNSTQVQDSVQITSVPEDKSLRAAILNSRLKSLYDQLEIIKVSNNLHYEEVILNINRQKALYTGQIKASTAEQERINIELKAWRSRAGRFHNEDIVTLARELSQNHPDLKAQLEEFEKISWEYLRNINSPAKADALYKLRLEKENELKKTVKNIVDSKLQDLDKKLNLVKLELNLFKSKLAELSKQEQFFKEVMSKELEAKRELEERIMSEIITLENELKSLS